MAPAPRRNTVEQTGDLPELRFTNAAPQIHPARNQCLRSRGSTASTRCRIKRRACHLHAPNFQLGWNGKLVTRSHRGAISNHLSCNRWIHQCQRQLRPVLIRGPLGAKPASKSGEWASKAPRGSVGENAARVSKGGKRWRMGVEGTSIRPASNGFLETPRHAPSSARQLPSGCLPPTVCQGLSRKVAPFFETRMQRPGHAWRSPQTTCVDCRTVWSRVAVKSPEQTS
jgi:hypothetical protein